MHVLFLWFTDVLTYFIGSFLQFTDRVNPADKHAQVLASKYDIVAAPITPQMFGAAGRDHMEMYGMKIYKGRAHNYLKWKKERRVSQLGNKFA